MIGEWHEVMLRAHVKVVALILMQKRVKTAKNKMDENLQMPFAVTHKWTRNRHTPVIKLSICYTWLGRNPDAVRPRVVVRVALGGE
jgi:hypothetical protein